jgi:hypothetical protein
MEISTIKTLLENTLPKNAYINVSTYKGMSSNYIAIIFASKDYLINNVSGQRPDVVSLAIHLDSLELYPQIFGGNGGQRIFRKPNLNDEKEKYLAMKSVKIPFRKPQNNETAILKAIKLFAERWVNVLKENRENLQYQNIVNYDEFLNL